MGISFWHIVIVLLFGAGKIPRLMKDLGSGVTAFKKGLKQDDPAETPPAATPANPQIASPAPAAAEKKTEEAVRRS